MLVLVVLIILSLGFMIASFLYLADHGRKESSENGENSENKKENPGTLVRNNKKILVYNIIAWLFLCGISVALVTIYPDHSLIAHMKPIALLSILITVTVSDIKKQIIPNVVILAGIVIRVMIAVVEWITLGTEYLKIFKGDMSSLVMVLVLFILGTLVVKNGIGMGDIKLIMVMGLFQGLTTVIASIFFSLLVAFVISVALLLTRKKTRKDSIAFAPSALIGTAVTIILTGM